MPIGMTMQLPAPEMLVYVRSDGVIIMATWIEREGRMCCTSSQRTGLAPAEIVAQALVSVVCDVWA